MEFLQLYKSAKILLVDDEFGEFAEFVVELSSSDIMVLRYPVQPLRPCA